MFDKGPGGTSVATSLARRVEIAEAHRIQSPRYRSRSSDTASEATIDHAALLKRKRHQAPKTVMAGLNVDSKGERIGVLERRLGRYEQKWSCERISDCGQGPDCPARSGCKDAAMALNADVCNFDIDFPGAACGLVCHDDEGGGFG